MLNDADASGLKKVYLAMEFTDLRRGIDGLHMHQCNSACFPKIQSTLFR